jgi:hypothetical protein
MSLTVELTRAGSEALPGVDGEKTLFRSLEGTILQVDCRKQELTVAAEGRHWNFVLAEDCQLWFHGESAPLRAFHPLERIRVFYQTQDRRHLALALYVWEFFP